MSLNCNLPYIFVTLGIFLISGKEICGQTQLIYYDDTLAQQKYMGRFENHLQQPYYGKPYYDFKEKLTDGIYIFLDAYRKDSLKIKIGNKILIKGQYVDSLRTGKFEYYVPCETAELDESTELTLVHVYHYRKGLLNGYYLSGHCKGKLYEGNYKMGKRHGFFFTYSDNGDLIKVELYQEDTLSYQSMVPDITKAKSDRDILEHRYLTPK